MSRITVNILKDSTNADSYKYSNLNLLRIVMAGNNKAKNISRRYK